MDSVSSAILLVPDHVQREAFGDLVQNALRLLGFLQQVGNLRERRHLHPQLLVQQHAQLIHHAGVARVRHGDLEGPVLPLNRHEVVPEHQVDGDGVKQVVIDADFPQIHELVVIALRERLRARRLLHRVLRNHPVTCRHSNLEISNLL